MPKALQHEYPRWEGDEHDPTEDVYVWPGKPRFVSACRARKLRKRGVPLMPLHAVRTVDAIRFDKCTGYETYSNRIEPTTPDDRARYAWFEPTEHAEARQGRRRLRCYLVATRPQPFGRKAWLTACLEHQRLGLAARWAARAVAKALYGRYTMPPPYSFDE